MGRTWRTSKTAPSPPTRQALVSLPVLVTHCPLQAYYQGGAIHWSNRLPLYVQYDNHTRHFGDGTRSTIKNCAFDGNRAGIWSSEAGGGAAYLTANALVTRTMLLMRRAHCLANAQAVITGSNFTNNMAADSYWASTSTRTNPALTSYPYSGTGGALEIESFSIR